MDYMLKKLPMARTEYEFATFRGLCADGKKPKQLKPEDVSESDWLQVWSSPLDNGKMKISLVRPAFRSELGELVHKVYQKKLVNNEVRTLFARAFAWQHTSKALSNKKDYLVNWASFAADSYKDSLKKQSKKTPLNAFDRNIQSLMSRTRKLREMKAEAESRLVKIEEEALRMEGSMTISKQYCDHLADAIEEKYKLRCDLQRVAEGDEDYLKQAAGFKCEEDLLRGLLEDTLRGMGKDKYSQLVEEISQLKRDVKSYEHSIESWHSRATQVNVLKTNKKLQEMRISMGIYNLPLCATSDACELCGLQFSEDYSMLVKLKCNHKWHVACFGAVLVGMHCLVAGCNESVPHALLLELDHVTEHAGLDVPEESEEQESAGDTEVEEPKVLPYKRKHVVVDTSDSSASEEAPVPERRFKKRVTRSAKKKQQTKEVAEDADEDEDKSSPKSPVMKVVNDVAKDLVLEGLIGEADEEGFGSPMSSKCKETNVKHYVWPSNTVKNLMLDLPDSTLASPEKTLPTPTLPNPQAEAADPVSSPDDEAENDLTLAESYLKNRVESLKNRVESEKKV